jgi:hypothetical protein
MTPANVAATERSVPVFPDRRVTYLRKEVSYAYTVRSGPSFNVELRRENGYWLVRDVEIGIFGYGSDVLEAMRDFKRAVEQHLDVLERQDALSEELSWQLGYLRARVRR